MSIFHEEPPPQLPQGRVVTPTPPIAGAEFDMYARATPEGEWSYVVDDGPIVYGKQPWPFRRFSHINGRGRVYTEAGSVRLSPDVAYYSWRNEYVLLYARKGGASVYGRLHLWVAPQGMGGWVYDAWFDIEVPSFEGAFRGVLPPEVAEQGAVKLARITAFLRAEASRRDAGRRAPVTAGDLYARAQRAQEG